MKKKKIIILVIGLGLFLLMSEVFARYEKDNSIKGEIELAKWDFQVNNNMKSYSMDLVSDSGKIIPGSSGTISLDITYFDMEVSFYYTVELDRTTLPDNLIIYEDENYEKEFSNLERKVLLSDEREEDKITLYWKWNYSSDNEDSFQNKRICALFYVKAYQIVGDTY